MKLVRTLLMFSAALLISTISITAQGGQKTWTDEDLDKLMKEIGGAVGATRKAIDGQNAELAKTNAAKMATLFTDVQAFWKARKVTDAADIAGEAMKHAKAVEGAVDAKDFTKAAEHAKMLQGTCASCHGKYRDKGPDGNYRIKP
jgi:Sec-independent protein translocase protein TatA